ncbi:MAG: glycosyltransferase [Acidobacteriota bacterium]
MTGQAQIAAIVPTLGRSPVLEDCLQALDEQRPRPLLVVVRSGPGSLPDAARERADILLESSEQLGFAAATNRGIEATETSFVATVNDDVVVRDGWVRALLEAAAESEGFAAVQGANTLLDSPQVLDGCGIAWNTWWQAVQLRAGEATSELPTAAFEIAGASATATLYRRSALTEVALEGGEAFDPSFESYYEDVDLSLRLAAAGHRAVCVPAARAAHVGSATGKTLGRHRLRLIYGNRLLTLRRAAGGASSVLAKALLRDFLDGLRQPSRIPGILGGWRRAWQLRHRFPASGTGAALLAQLRDLAGRSS